MKSSCPPPDVLVRIADGERVARKETQHVAQCPSCRRVLTLARTITAENLTITIDDATVAEDRIASLVAELLQVPMEERPRLASEARFMVPEVATRFNQMAMAEFRHDLRLAHSHAHVSTVISSSITQRLGVAGEVEFECWKTRSSILREQGDFDSARSSLLFARRAMARCSDRELKAAILDFAAAAICVMRDVWSPAEAEALLDLCAPVFAVRAPERLVAVKSVRGTIALISGEYARALEVYSEVAAAVAPTDEAAWANAHRNVVNALARMKMVDKADDLLRRVRRLDVKLGRTLDIVKDDALAALIAEESEDHLGAAAMYADVRRRFADCGELETALLAGKDAAVALVAAGLVDQARHVLASLLTPDVVLDTDRKRFTSEAISYLRELADREVLTADVASEVARYIDRIHLQRAEPFRSPLPLFTM